MPIPANQIQFAEVKMFGLASAQGSTDHPFTYTFNFFRANLSLPITKQPIEIAFQAAIAVPVMLALNNTAVQTFNTIRFPDDALDAPVQFTRAIAGAVTGDAMTKTNSAFVLMRSGLRGRSYRGSKHFFPLSESDTTAAAADVLNAAAITRFTAVTAAMVTAWSDTNGNSWTPCVISKKLSQLTVNPTTIVDAVVNQVLLNSRIGTMVKRKVRSVY